MSNALMIKKANTTQNYAQIANQRFSNVKEMYVDVQTRIDQCLSLNPERDRLEDRLDSAMTRWELNNPCMVQDTSKFFKVLPRSLTCKLSDIKIDVTLQRYVYFQKIIDILLYFKGVNVQAIRVYEDEESGNIVCWDGQHTLIALYYVIVRVLKLNPTQIDIPIVISSGTEKTEARRASLNENGPGKNPFDAFDVYEQEVYGVRIDGADDEEWLKTEEKQRYLEQNDLFLANSRMYNDHLPGALTRYEEISDDEYPPIVTKWFATWCKEVNGSNRPFGGTEVDLMYGFIKTVMDQGKITVDKKYIMQVADTMRKVKGDDFSGTMFYNRVKDSYKAHLKREAEAQFKAYGTYPSYVTMNGDIHPNAVTGRKTARMHTFLCAMLKADGVAIPKLEHDWKVPKKDLF